MPIFHLPTGTVISVPRPWPWSRKPERRGAILHRTGAPYVAYGRKDGSGKKSKPGFRILIPDNIEPGQEFNAYVHGHVFRIRCPLDALPGQSLAINIKLPQNSNGGDGWYGGDPAPSLPSSPLPGLTFPPDSENATKIPGQDLYNVEIPEGVRGGQQFPVIINGTPLQVTCPNSSRPGMSVRVVPPPADDGDAATLPRKRRSRPRIPLPEQPDGTRRFEVVVPRGVEPGKPFALFAGGARVLVTCPQDAASGQKIQFDLRIELVDKVDSARSESAQIKLSYDKDGWTRTIRATDMMFQWTRFDERGNVDERRRFDADRSAYVLKLDFLDDDYLRRGRVRLVTPEKGVVHSNVKGADGSELASYSDIVSAQMKTYKDKINWFRDTCSQLTMDWGKGFKKIDIRREYLLSDSVQEVMALSRQEMRMGWRFEFAGEDGLDLGGLKREWFELVTKAVFDPNMGLWQSSATNQMCMQINPASAICCPNDHLMCFRFIGRVMGKAILDGELVKGHMVTHLYKHLLRWPVMFNDLKDIDEEYFRSIKGLKDLGADVEHVSLDFTTTEEILGMKPTVDLVPGGAGIGVTEDNLPEYIEACLRYRLLGQSEAQLNELLLGFYDVLPEPLLTIFDFQELELLMCGLPKIEMNDWMEHTEYTGDYDRDGPSHGVCVWFWEVVSDYDQEMKARLLQFVTGTSGVPANGFSSLRGNDGNTQQFTIQGVGLDTCVYPRSHTCFNRLDLPLYETRDELEEKLRISVTMASTGFSLD